MSETFPVVYTKNARHTPDRVVKKPWGVILLYDDGKKVSRPWSRIKSVKEELEPVESDDEIARFP